MSKYDIPKNEQILSCIYAYLSQDKNGEGIISAYNTLINSHMPFVCGHKRMLKIFEPMAKDLAKETGKKIILVKYTMREIIEEIDYRN